MRKAAQNTFTDGMVKDFNPINVPSTVLTDCLNGTILTYNGNEMSLQNDMGNYGLENCKLPSGYVPMGLKEFGGILYIVSYNPINNRVEIGSYPSTKKLTSIGEDNSSITITPVDWEATDDENGLEWNDIHYQKYSNILKNNCALKVFINTDTISEADNCLINPEDEFELEINQDEETTPITSDAYEKALKYQKIAYYIMDSDQRLTEITDHIYSNKEFTEYVNSDKKEVDWSIPGWFAAQLKVFNPSDFKLIFSLTTTPQFASATDVSDVHFNFKCRLYTEDNLYSPKATSTDTYTVLYKIERDGYNAITGALESEVPCVDMLNGTRYYNSNSSDLESLDAESKKMFENVTRGTEFKITAYPCYGNVVYDNLKIEYKYIADNVIFSKSLEVGTETWQYYATRSENSDYPQTLTLRFNVAGYEDNLSPTLYYRIERLTGTSTSEAGEDQNDWESVTPLNTSFTESEEENPDKYIWEEYSDVISKNVTSDLVFSLSDYSQVDSFEEGDNILVAEAIYRITFRIKVNDQYSKQVQKEFISSELFQSCTATKNFDNLAASEWLSHYSDYIRGAKVSVDYTVGDIVTLDEPNWFTFLNKKEDSTHPYAVNKNTWDAIVGNSNIVSVYAEQDVEGTITKGLENYLLPHGPIWNSVETKTVSLELNYSGKTKQFIELKVDQKSGKLIIPETVSFNTAVSYSDSYKATNAIETFDYLPYTLVSDNLFSSEILENSTNYGWGDGRQDRAEWLIENTFPNQQANQYISVLGWIANETDVTVDRGAVWKAYILNKFSGNSFGILPIRLKVMTLKRNSFHRADTYITYTSGPQLKTENSATIKGNGSSSIEWTYYLVAVSKYQSAPLLIQTPNSSTLYKEDDSAVQESMKNLIDVISKHFRKYVASTSGIYKATYVKLQEISQQLNSSFTINSNLKFEIPGLIHTYKGVTGTISDNSYVLNELGATSFTISSDKIATDKLKTLLSEFETNKVNPYNIASEADRVDFTSDDYRSYGFSEGKDRIVNIESQGNSQVTELINWMNGTEASNILRIDCFVKNDYDNSKVECWRRFAVGWAPSSNCIISENSWN